MKSQQAADVIVSVTKKANFLKNTILLGKTDVFLRVFAENWYVTPSLFSGTHMYHTLSGFLVGVEI